MSLPGWIKGRGASGFGYDSTATDVTEGLDLRGKTVLVTGCASGLGAETMRVLAGRGARVLGAARTLAGATRACAAAGGETVPLACDLSEPASVRDAVRHVTSVGQPLDAIVANAGIMAVPRLQLQHGYEAQFFTNHVGHHLLVTRLLAQLADTARVVMVSSSLHTAAPPEGIQFDNLAGEKSYAPWTAYGQSKLANLLFARHLARRLPKPGQTANAVHPGVIRTNLQRHMNPALRVAFFAFGPLFLKSAAQGAATQTYVAVHPGAASTSGEYFADCNVAPSSALGRDAALAERLWQKTEEILARLP